MRAGGGSGAKPVVRCLARWRKSNWTAILLDASPRLFANPILDKLSRVHHLTPLLVYAPVVLVLLVIAWQRLPLPAILPAVVGGYVVWTISEYWGHRLLFHWTPPGRFGERINLPDPWGASCASRPIRCGW